MNLRLARRKLRAWGRRQLYSLFSSLGTLLGHRLGTLMTVMVLGIAMLLPMGLYLSVNNLRSLDLTQDQWGAITVFMQPGIDEPQVLDLSAALQTRFAATTQTVSPTEGMQEFREASGFGQALNVFEESPLPWVLLVSPAAGSQDEVDTAALELAAWLEGQEQVDFVQVDYKWLQRLSGILALGNAIVTVLGLLFSLAVVVVVSNTIRLDVANRAEEIQVLSLVGAGNNFIRQPFLYAGFWYGLLGALLALILLQLSMFYLQQPLERLVDAYGNRFTVRGLGLVEILGLVLAGGLLGFFGAWISVQRYLRQLRLGGRLGSI